MPVNLNRWPNNFANGNLRIGMNKNWDQLEGKFNAFEQTNDNLIQDAKIAKEKAEAADTLSKNVQKQLDEAVIKGDSSPAADQARVDAIGKTHPSLKARADNDFNTLTAQINVLSQNSLAKLCQDMAKGEYIVIDCFGDSTYYGLKVGGGRVDTPAPTMLQTILQSYYGNVNITVNNRGLNSNQTTNALRSFENDVKNSVASIIYINYGLNDLTGANPTGVSDPKINAEQYRQNLRLMVTIARKYNKVVILDSPNVQLANHGGGDFQFRMEGTQQFSNTMKQVARELNVPFIDQQYLTNKYLQGALNIPDAFPDGLHPSQEVYIQKGINMALPIVAPTMMKIKGPTIIPAGLPGMQATNAKYDTSTNKGARTGLFYYSTQSVRAAIWVDEPGLDIYVSTCQWSGGTASCNFKVDGTIIGNASINDNALITPIYATENEILVLENAKPGLHFIELENAEPSGNVGLYYLRAYRTRYQLTRRTTTTYVSRRVVVAEEIDIAEFTEQNPVGHIMLDVPTSRLLDTCDVEMIASLNKGDGMILFTKPISDGSQPHGGLYVYLDNYGFLKYSEGSGKGGYINNTILSEKDHSNTQHRYRVTVTPSGLATFYVDDIEVGTYNMTKPHIGGFLGLFKNSYGKTRINKLSVY
ncbi:SGNH/GDSL hydrolase family protein [Bacillus sp. EE-W1]|uniref:SGNH/GDSL hydrolase family protein n=1 Tax=Bacillus sp. EE-W1 TaxID=2662453 RepID=UPI0012F9541E|nr:SGNH/GDSL hydrolase family protein [Bacillus sp. EE-W1]